MDRKELENLVNDLTVSGHLPLPYYNSKIIEEKINKVNSGNLSEKKVLVPNINEKYKQINVASGFFGRLNTKIYDIY